MKTFSNFKRYIPDDLLFPGIENILHLKEENGLDWYQLQKEFSSETLKIAYDSNGIIRSCSMDASALFPENLSVSEVNITDVPIGDDLCLGEWVFDGKSIKAREYSAEEWREKTEELRRNLLTDAYNITADWRTDLQLDEITDEDKSSLIEWMSYIKALKALDLSSAINEEGYKLIAWPDKP